MARRRRTNQRSCSVAFVITLPGTDRELLVSGIVSYSSEEWGTDLEFELDRVTDEETSLPVDAATMEEVERLDLVQQACESVEDDPDDYDEPD